uniref:putative phospholipase B-like 2 n=1 Tax=Ciona intestinalis TaxID=7719 RepID=UPI00089DC2D6|nr:putative phospholipase B-like 2 [Ciona intestinalis]|eukprot:XP_009857458.2 putative phospholipase B-like 2 [Ciona intestinalis]
MKMNFIFYLALLVVPCYSLVQEMSKPQPAILHKIHFVDDGYKLVSMYASDEGMKLHHKLPENVLSVATFKSTINENGWAKLSITTNPTHSNKKQAYAAGYLEGTATKSMIEDNWFNTIGDMCNPMSTFCLNLKKFLESNMEFMISMIKNNPDSPYWKQVRSCGVSCREKWS